MPRSLTILTAALLFALPEARAATPTPATDVPASCGTTLAQKAWMFQGQRGYFFYGDELSGLWMQRPWAEARSTFVPGAVRLAATLKARGVTLVLAPVPPRSFVTPGQLSSASPAQKAFDTKAAQAFYAGLVADLRAAGVPTADLLTPAVQQGDAGLFRQDIHWTPQGAQAAAQAVTATVGTLRLLPSQDAFVSLRSGTVTRQVQDQPVLGQLATLCGLTVAPETYAEYQTRPAGALVAAPGNFGASEGTVRWAFGPVAGVSYAVKAAGPVTVDATFETPLEGQGVEVRAGGKVLDTIQGLKRGENVTRRWTVDAAAGGNDLEFRFADYNGGRTTFAPGDGRPMAVIFKKLTVTSSDVTVDLVKGDSAGSGLLAGAADVVLVGASSSLPSLNFAGFLQEGLGVRVDNVSFGGAGVFSSLKDYLLDDAFTQSRPKVLIWQVPLLGGEDTAEADLRFVTAAALGARGGVTASGTGQVGLDTGNLTPRAVRVHAADAAVQAVTVTVTTDSGTRTFRIVNSDRMTHRQDFLLSLDGLGKVKRVDVKASGALTLDVTP
ncbi:alginate O-acetyltransferase AlgX-related protein [Deinococcus depolymerans]|uniref:AlgX/AlgJ SGNH hydrolase-like domain-containing protein n=1 Tax=Deinococcus depolymerans TaxID=392408 RepID=A0ABN1BQ26_9DEIO